jgi:hypothetical protein
MNTSLADRPMHLLDEAAAALAGLGAATGLGLPGIVLLTLCASASAILIATSQHRARLERRDNLFFHRFEAQLAAWSAASGGRAGQDLLDEARRVLDDEIAQHVQQDRSLDGRSRMRFANTLRSVMRQRLEDVLVRGQR